MPAPQAILDLIARFEEHKDDYHAGAYSETEIRTEFIDPFFEELGWDLANKAGFAEQYKDVVREASVEVEGGQKKPDYEFRIGGNRKFYVEAKKPSINLKNDIAPAFQIRRYAWSAKLSLGILTDFEEMAVYDCRNKPKASDSAGIGRIYYYSYKDYVEKWDEIAAIFSKDAIQRGAFDKFAISDKKRGTETVDNAFLTEIEDWRLMLAQNIALRNGQLTVEQLNYSVQQTIDRIIFLRICEDRGIESYGDLKKIMSETNAYQALLQHFLKADDRYNSGLFHFKKEKDNAEAPDDLTPSLKIDDKPLKDIAKRLYYPNCPYEFSVISADILGQVYERFLGKVIRLTDGHQAKVDDKPEVKKAGGVYYTPTYIVEYIVKNTVGKLVEGKTPAQVDKLKVLDPACGSGSFLIGAYQFLLDWHLEYYSNHEPAKLTKGKNPKLYQADGGGWMLTLPERRRILINNIHGVDIDAQAVEVTKLSLLLKVLESETQQRLFDKRVLPDLSPNIKCGNSLIGTDYFADKLIIEPEELARINPMDWEQAFPEIMKSGGFDAVIGNPPYVRIQTMDRLDSAYFAKKYLAARGNYDIYCIFVEQGLLLAKNRGLMAFIMPHRFFKTDYGQSLRELVVAGEYVREIIDFDGYYVFSAASINTCILSLGKFANSEFVYRKAAFTSAGNKDIGVLLMNENEQRDLEFPGGSISIGSLSSNPWEFILQREQSVWEKLEQYTTRLNDITDEIFQGLKTGADSIFIGDFVESHEGRTTIKFKDSDGYIEVENKLIRYLIKGGQMKRYHVAQSGKRVLFPYEDGKLISIERMVRDFPLTWAHLLNNRASLEKRDHSAMRGSKWYGYSRNQALDIMETIKIITPDYYDSASFCIDESAECYFCGGGAGGYGIIPGKGMDPFYLLGLLNSRLLDWYLKKISVRAYQTAFMYTKKYISRLPIVIDGNQAGHVKRIADLARNIVELKKASINAQTNHEKEVRTRQLIASEEQVDQLVYELYGLTEEEIKIVEGH